MVSWLDIFFMCSHAKWKQNNTNNIFLRKLHTCILTFTLITNLTFDFKKYNVIYSHLKKRTPRYLDHLKTRKCP